MADNSYAQLIDDFEAGIQVLEGETLTEYIKRMGGVDYNAHGGSVGIEVLFKQKGGTVNGPKSKNIKGQDHMLAYITPNEAKKLETLGGKETMTKEGIPAYPEWDSMYGAESKASFDKGIAPKGNVNWSGGGDGGGHHPPVIIPKKKPPVVIPKDDNPPWYSPGQLINNPLLNFINPKSKLGLGLGIFKTIKNFQPTEEDIKISETATLPGKNLLAKVSKQDLARYSQQKDLIDKQDYSSAMDTTLAGSEMTEFEFNEMKKGNITKPGTYVGETQMSKDGGRVGFVNGGWADDLTGEALSIYNSMSAYDASDAEIQAKLQEQNLWSPDGTTPNTGQVTGITNQNIGGMEASVV